MEKIINAIVISTITLVLSSGCYVGMRIVMVKNKIQYGQEIKKLEGKCIGNKDGGDISQRDIWFWNDNKERNEEPFSKKRKVLTHKLDLPENIMLRLNSHNDSMVNNTTRKPTGKKQSQTNTTNTPRTTPGKEEERLEGFITLTSRYIERVYEREMGTRMSTLKSMKDQMDKWTDSFLRSQGETFDPNSVTYEQYKITEALIIVPKNIFRVMIMGVDPTSKLNYLPYGCLEETGLDLEDPETKYYMENLKALYSQVITKAGWKNITPMESWITPYEKSKKQLGELVHEKPNITEEDWIYKGRKSDDSISWQPSRYLDYRPIVEEDGVSKRPMTDTEHKVPLTLRDTQNGFGKTIRQVKTHMMQIEQVRKTQENLREFFFKKVKKMIQEGRTREIYEEATGKGFCNAEEGHLVYTVENIDNEPRIPDTLAGILLMVDKSKGGTLIIKFKLPDIGTKEECLEKLLSGEMYVRKTDNGYKIDIYRDFWILQHINQGHEDDLSQLIVMLADIFYDKEKVATTKDIRDIGKNQGKESADKRMGWTRNPDLPKTPYNRNNL